MLKKIIILSACLLILCGTALDFHAQQSGSATLRGIITDPQGAVIPNAAIKATLIANGTTRETQTNGDGAYVLSNLSPGEYEVRVEAQGFTITKLEGATLQIGQSQTLDFALEVGTLNIVLDGDFGGVPRIDTNSSKVDQVINAREIENLPLNGRNFLELALLTPGNAPAPNFDPTKSNTVVISSAGQLGRGGSVTIDGADTNDDVVGGAVQNISQDAVQEFQIATNRFDARLGRSGSGIINVVTKQGTNCTALPPPTSAITSCKDSLQPLTARRGKNHPSTASSIPSRSAAPSRKTRRSSSARSNIAIKTERYWSVRATRRGARSRAASLTPRSMICCPPNVSTGK